LQAALRRCARRWAAGPSDAATTLVEHAVKYGIAARPEVVKSDHRALCERALSIRVTIRRSRDADTSPTRRAANGVGLRNAPDRLRLLFWRTRDPAASRRDAMLVGPEAPRATAVEPRVKSSKIRKEESWKNRGGISRENRFPLLVCNVSRFRNETPFLISMTKRLASL